MSRAWRDWLPADDGEVALADRPEPTPDIPRLGIYFGAQVGWDTRREGGTIDVTVARPVTGEPVVVAVCPECYSGIVGEPLAGRQACGGCLRSAFDTLAEDLRGRHPVMTDAEIAEAFHAAKRAGRKAGRARTFAERHAGPSK